MALKDTSHRLGRTLYATAAMSNSVAFCAGLLLLFACSATATAAYDEGVNRACSHNETFAFCNSSLSLSARTQNLVSLLPPIAYPDLMVARHSAPVPSLGIPAYDWGVNSIHGDQVGCGTNCATNYPCPVAIGASFNRSLVHSLASMMAVELRALRLEGVCEKHLANAVAATATAVTAVTAVAAEAAEAEAAAGRKRSAQQRNHTISKSKRGPPPPLSHQQQQHQQQHRHQQEGAAGQDGQLRHGSFKETRPSQSDTGQSAAATRRVATQQPERPVVTPTATASSSSLPDACIGLDTWAPNINLGPRDPRWGRNWEVATEDPYAAGEIAVAYAQGFQTGEDDRYLKGIITLKHWAAYLVEANRGGFNDKVAPFDLADSYLPAFRAGVVKGRAAGIMCSYNSINGVPTCASNALNDQLLRGTWGFDGYITSDSGAVSDIYAKHKYTKSPEAAVAAAINAGVDINSGSMYSRHLPKAMMMGLTNASMVTRALERAFRVRMRLGLFDSAQDQPYAHYGPERVGSAAHHQLSLEASRQGLVLLQNRKETLPLAAAGQLKLALIGPNVNTRALLVGGTGGCSKGACLSAEVVCAGARNASDWRCVPSIADEIRRLNAGANVSVAQGASIHAGYDPKQGAEAVAAARAADAVIFVLGGDWQVDHEGMDRADLMLPGGQNDLVRAVMTDDGVIGKPSAAVLVHGGVMDISNVSKYVDAILDASYPGMHGGTAVAETLFGAVNPGGKLPVTYYKNSYVASGQLDMDDLSMARAPLGRTYRFYNGTALFPAFHGLSYTNFTLAWGGGRKRSADDGHLTASANRSSSSSSSSSSSGGGGGGSGTGSGGGGGNGSGGGGSGPRRPLYTFQPSTLAIPSNPAGTAGALMDDEFGPDGPCVNYTVRVTNTGPRFGTETVFAFLRQPGWVHPLGKGFLPLKRWLVGYTKVALSPNKGTAEVSLPVCLRATSQVHASGDRWAESGLFEVIISRGTKGAQELVHQLNVTGSARLLERYPAGL